MFKKTLAIILTLLILISLGACSLWDGDTTTESEVESEVVTTFDTTEVTAELLTTEAESSAVNTYVPLAVDITKGDIKGFINLDRSLTDDNKPYLTKDEILSFDKLARYVGTVPEHSYNYSEFTFFIESRDHTMFGYDGFLYYPVKIDANEVIDNTEDYPHDFYSPCYKYIGDGSDIPFGDDMMFTIQNATYNDYVDVLSGVAKLAGTNENDINIIHDLTFKKLEYSGVEDIPEILSVDNYDAVVENQDLKLYSQALYIPDSTNYPFYVKVDWLSEKHFSSQHNMYKEVFSGNDNISNRIVIRIYRGSSEPEPIKSSERYISDTYTCSSDYFSTLSTTPSICFNKNGDCVISVNYSGGICNMEGKYYIQGDKIYVKLSFDNTIFEDTGNEYTDLDYMSNKYVFSIVNDTEIVINRGCYAVKAGDGFVLTN